MEEDYTKVLEAIVSAIDNMRTTLAEILNLLRERL
jgi:hypothetical protein